ncbi:MAG: hydroxymethylglutaryl-CoA reductase [Saprospiraceae bacterium]
MKSKVDGFSKWSKQQKLEWIQTQSPTLSSLDFSEFDIKNLQLQKTIDGFSENTVANYVMPYGIAPNFLIDGALYHVPMVIEESSVVAAASSAAKYWLTRGGFKTEIKGTIKTGHIHFKWYGDKDELFRIFPELEVKMCNEAAHITANMQQRGGGILKTELKDFTHELPNVFQIMVYFDTKNSMGANFINSVLECFASTLESFVIAHPDLPDSSKDIDIIMSILSNYTPECIVKAEVSCPIQDLGSFSNGMVAETLAQKFKTAVDIAHIDVFRATTHNKGIFNGIDAVVLATGNDFRAVEAAGHAYAARQGNYRSLSFCTIDNELFKFWIEVPLALGTVGGLTTLHPLAKASLDLLENPDSERLMRIIASVGLAQNFSAIRSLVTTGIQHGHMKMHLLNILNSLQANDFQIAGATKYFENKTVSYAGVREYLALHSTTNTH